MPFTAMPTSPQSGGSVSPTNPPVSLPLNIAEQKHTASSPASSVASSLPTPLSASFVSATGFGFPAQQPATGAVRRKPSRRANTAERRATHNAVERARRETLNGRFLDLAALLPNLVSVRRPSKSAIVNSSIALIHTQRRARATAGRELRNLKAEADSLRRELNEWRERACLPCAEEPLRNADFMSLIALQEEDAEEGEEERAAYAMMEMERGMGGGGYGMRDGDDGDDDSFGPDDVLGLESTSPQQPAPAQGMAPMPLATMQHHPQMMHAYPAFDEAEKLAAWNPNLYNALQWQTAQAQAQAQMFQPQGPFADALGFQQGMFTAEEETSSAGDQTSHRGSPPLANHAGTQTGFDDLVTAYQHAQHVQTRAARSASLGSYGTSPVRKHVQHHVAQPGSYAPMGLLI